MQSREETTNDELPGGYRSLADYFDNLEGEEGISGVELWIDDPDAIGSYCSLVYNPIEHKYLPGEAVTFPGDEELFNTFRSDSA